MKGTGGDFTETFDAPGGVPAGPIFRPPPRWRLVRPIGRGGQAEVWLAEDLELGQEVVLKVFHRIEDPVAVERMRREVRLGRELHHPGLVRIFDLEEMNGRLVAVMEWVPGGSLAAVERERLPVDRVVEIADQVLETLAHLHGRGIVHRDVKPSNLLVDREGRVHLCDLGLARRLTMGDDLTRTRMTVGTPTYMAPEQLRGEELSPAVDLYALGVTLYQLLSGMPPFGAISEYEMADAILHGRPRPLRALRPDCPPWLASFIHRLLERSPADRFPDAGTALAAFRKRRRVGSPRRRRMAAVAVTVVAMALATGAGALRLANGTRAMDHVELAGNDLVAFDARGHELWRHRVALKKVLLKYAVGDWLGTPEPELAVLRPQNGDYRKVIVDVLGHGGRRVATLKLQEGRGPYPMELSANWALQLLENADIDGDGYPELVWSVGHRVWYPSILGIWAPRLPVGRSVLLQNSGSIQQVVAADLDGDGAEELVVTGLNNPLGFQAFLGILDFPGAGVVRELAGLRSPDLVADGTGSSNGPGNKTLIYVPLGSRYTGARIVEAGPEGLGLVAGKESLRLDRDGNPEGSPLWGMPSGYREHFWSDLAALCRRLRISSTEEGLGSWEAFRSHHPLVIGEAASETAAALLAARAMADGGNHLGAARLLETTARRIPGERDLHLRAGEYRLIAGDRREGRADLLRSLPMGTGGRNAYDPFLLLALDAVFHGDTEAFEGALRVNRSVAIGAYLDVAGSLRPLLLWARGRWNDPRLGEISHDDALPVLAVVEPWTRLELGADPRELGREARRLAEVSDAVVPAQLLQAAAALRAGEPETAFGIAEETLATITGEGARSYEISCWRPVACLLAAEAALATGVHPDTRAWLETAAAAGPATWFGRRAAEILASRG